MSLPEKRADQVRRDAGQTSLPVDVEAIADWLGARVVYEPMSRDLSGLLFRDGDTIVIGVNSIHPSNRQRFTIAHEIGHLVLHEGQPVVLDHVVRLNYRDARSGTATDGQEIAANKFAAELLMPAALIRAEASRIRDAGKSIDDRFLQYMAEGFEVSAEALSNRLTNMGLASQI